jgi:hypothetical protein
MRRLRRLRLHSRRKTETLRPELCTSFVRLFVRSTRRRAGGARHDMATVSNRKTKEGVPNRYPSDHFRDKSTAFFVLCGPPAPSAPMSTTALLKLAITQCWCN